MALHAHGSSSAHRPCTHTHAPCSARAPQAGTAAYCLDSALKGARSSVRGDGSGERAAFLRGRRTDDDDDGGLMDPSMEMALRDVEKLEESLKQGRKPAA